MESLGIDVLRLIFNFLPVVDAVHFASTCVKLRTRLRRDARIAAFEDCFIRSARGLFVHGDLAEDKLVEAAKLGDMSLVKIFAARASTRLWAVYTASRWNHPEVVSYLRANHVSLRTEHIIDQLVNYGIAVRNNLSYDTPFVAINEACRFNDMEVIERIGETDYYTGFQIAAKHGHFNILEWAAASDKNANAILDAVAYSAASLQIIKWACEKFKHHIGSRIRIIYLRAIGDAQYDILEYLRGQPEYVPGLFLNRNDRLNVCAQAMDRGRVELFGWLAESGIMICKSRLARNLVRRIRSCTHASADTRLRYEVMFAALKSLEKRH